MDFKNFKDDKHYVWTLPELREIIRDEIQAAVEARFVEIEKQLQAKAAKEGVCQTKE